MISRNLKYYFLPLMLISSVFFSSERISFPGNIAYDPFYTAVIIDNDDTEYLVTNCSFISNADIKSEHKYFFWIRRGTDSGIASYTLDFNKIKSISFTGHYEDGPEGYTPAEIVLTNDKTFPVFVNTEGYLDGIDNDFGTYVRIYMNYNLIKSVTFQHNGSYKICPFCKAVYYDDTLTVCPFDGTILQNQNNRKINSAPNPDQ